MKTLLDIPTGGRMDEVTRSLRSRKLMEELGLRWPPDDLIGKKFRFVEDADRPGDPESSTTIHYTMVAGIKIELGWDINAKEATDFFHIIPERMFVMNTDRIGDQDLTIVRINLTEKIGDRSWKAIAFEGATDEECAHGILTIL